MNVEKWSHYIYTTWIDIHPMFFKNWHIYHLLLWNLCFLRLQNVPIKNQPNLGSWGCGFVFKSTCWEDELQDDPESVVATTNGSIDNRRDSGPSEEILLHIASQLLITSVNLPLSSPISTFSAWTTHIQRQTIVQLVHLIRKTQAFTNPSVEKKKKRKETEKERKKNYVYRYLRIDVRKLFSLQKPKNLSVEEV